MTKNIFKRIVFILAFSITLLTPTFAGAAGQGDVDPTAQTDGTYCGVSDSQIKEYMAMFGYYVQKITPVPGSCDVVVTTQYSFHTRIVIVESQIIDYEDMPN
jgi:hypothetical protein